MRHLSKTHLFLFFILLISGYSQAQSWNVIGSAGFTSGAAGWTSIAIDKAGTPYVLYRDEVNWRRSTVMKYDGSAWVAVGGAFSTGGTFWNSIVIDSAGKPYVTYQDSAYGNGIVVKKYTGSLWVNVGTPGFSGGVVQEPTIALTKGGTPYVAFEDFNHSYKLTVMKFSGGSWVTVGPAGLSPGVVGHPAIALDSADMPYVTFGDQTTAGYPNTVMKYDGTNWVFVGPPHFSAGNTYGNTIAIDRFGTPYVAYSDYANGRKVTVMKYDGSNWVNVGSPGFSDTIVLYLSLALDGCGTPFVGYSESSTIYATVKKYDGINWVTVGTTGFSSGQTLYNSLAVDWNGTPYMAFSENTYGGKATAMRFQIPPSAIEGITTICIDSSTTLTDSAPSGIWKSDNTAVAIVDACAGVVKGISAGTVTLSYTAYDSTVTTIVTVSNCVTTKVHAKNGDSPFVTISPNPSRGCFALKLSSDVTENVTIIITNIFGQKVKENVITTNTSTELQLNALPGIYFMSAATKNECVTSKIIVE